MNADSERNPRIPSVQLFLDTTLDYANFAMSRPPIRYTTIPATLMADAALALRPPISTPLRKTAKPNASSQPPKARAGGCGPAGLASSLDSRTATACPAFAVARVTSGQISAATTPLAIATGATSHPHPNLRTAPAIEPAA